MRSCLGSSFFGDGVALETVLSLEVGLPLEAGLSSEASQGRYLQYYLHILQ
jgi:hypothetical protein